MLHLTEKTLYSFITDIDRLQLLCINGYTSSECYEVRLNRRLVIRTDYLPEAIAHFKSHINDILSPTLF